MLLNVLISKYCFLNQVLITAPSVPYRLIIKGEGNKKKYGKEVTVKFFFHFLMFLIHIETSFIRINHILYTEILITDYCFAV